MPDAFVLDPLLLAGLASDLIQRTASTPAVQQALQSSLAPAFLLVGIGSIMNVMVQRLTWIAGRIERLEERAKTDGAKTEGAGAERRELDWLAQRRRLVRRAIMLSSSAAVIISVVIALLFVSPYVSAKIGTVIAFFWVTTIVCLIGALFMFLRETSIAARGSESFKTAK